MSEEPSRLIYRRSEPPSLPELRAAQGEQRRLRRLAGRERVCLRAWERLAEAGRWQRPGWLALGLCWGAWWLAVLWLLGFGARLYDQQGPF